MSPENVSTASQSAGVLVGQIFPPRPVEP